MLYVLLVPRVGEHEPGRYQSPAPLEYDTVEEFCRRFQAFLETDGRHIFWIASRNGGTLVYDQHEWIYAYGDLPVLESILVQHGLQPGALELPSPHSHNYHPQFDDDEDSIMKYWDWIHSPIQPDDDP